jgi:hypothetical protein
MVYLILYTYDIYTYDMTPLSGNLYGHTYAVTCITIIDTFILHIHTNDAYYYDTHIPLSGGDHADGRAAAALRLKKCFLG